MKFETLYERYRSGTATPEEAELVEEELAKYRLLTDYVAEHDELDLPGGPETGEERGEVRRVRQAVRRVRAGTVLVAFVLVLLALLAWRFAAVPLLNRYVLYDPTADGDNYLDSLELEVAVLESLHFPEWSSQTVYAQETGLGSYDLTLYESGLAAGEWTATKGTMDLAGSRFEEDFYRRWVAINQFTRGTYPYYAPEQVPGHSPEETAAALAELPDYLDATLSLSFARDLSMEEFAGLAGRYPDLRFQWVGVRINDGERRQLLPLAGFDAAGLSMLGCPSTGRTATWERSIPGTSWPCSGTRRSGRSWWKRSAGRRGATTGTPCAMWRRTAHTLTASTSQAGRKRWPPCAARRKPSGSGSNPSGFQRALRVECGETSGAGTSSPRPSLL